MTDQREYAAQRAVGDVQLRHRPHVEPQVWIGLSGQLDHHRRGVDTERRQPQLAQMSGDVARSAAQVRDLTVPARADDLGEEAQGRAVEGTVTQRVAEQLRIGDGSGVVGIAGGAEGIVSDHARDSSSWRLGHGGTALAAYRVDGAPCPGARTPETPAVTRSGDTTAQVRPAGPR